VERVLKMDPIEWRFIYFLEREREGGPDDDMHIYDLVYSKRDNTIDILFIFFGPCVYKGGSKDRMVSSQCNRALRELSLLSLTFKHGVPPISYIIPSSSSSSLSLIALFSKIGLSRLTPPPICKSAEGASGTCPTVRSPEEYVCLLKNKNYEGVENKRVKRG